MKLVQLTMGKSSMVDDEDFERVSRLKWQAVPNRDGSVWYGRRYERISKNVRRPVFMHSFIMQNISVKFDHKDGDGLNNQKINLRPASSVENGRNRKLQKHSTPYKGVSLFKATGKYQCSITLEKKKVHVGFFGTPEAAAAAYDLAAIKHYGEFARTNQQMGAL